MKDESHDLPVLPELSAEFGLSRVSSTDSVLARESDGCELDPLLDLDEWRAAVREIETNSIARLGFRTVDSARLVASAIRRTHGEDVPLALDGEHLVLALPDGLVWDAVASTALATLDEPGELRAGLAELEGPAAGTRARSVGGLTEEPRADDRHVAGLRLSRAALETAIERFMPVAVRTMADEAAEERERSITASLVASLESGAGLRLVFQPKFDTRTRRVVGAEALLRHECVNLGAIGPAEFLPVAERAGIRPTVERWVLEEGLRAIGGWLTAGKLAHPISLNLAPADVFERGFVAELRAAMRSHHVDPSFLHLEVPESGLRGRLPEAIDRFSEIRALGVQIALDDFGESDLEVADLGALPIDALKVHRRCVLDMESSESATALVRGILSLAAVRGVDTIAAGVEAEPQLERLAAFGCKAVQGFLLSPPLERGAFERQL